MEFTISLLSAVLRMCVPILLAALGLVVSERAGVINIGAEGIMLIGAFAGFAGAAFTGSNLGGIVTAILSGIVLGIMFAYFVVSAKANQTVVGAALNIFGSGLTIMLNRLLFTTSTGGVGVKGLSALNFGPLSDLPILGELFFSHNLMVYVAFALVPITHYFLFKTEAGLSLRAVGENPRACDTVGINVYRVRSLATIYSACLCSVAGAYMSIGLMSSFTEGMVSGRGFIALAAVVFGKWKPKGLLAAVIIFGLGEALQYKLLALQTGVPYQFLQMLPYILTLFALARISKESIAPAASGTPYIKE